jgi:hypothetical protein
MIIVRILFLFPIAPCEPYKALSWPPAPTSYWPGLPGGRQNGYGETQKDPFLNKKIVKFSQFFSVNVVRCKMPHFAAYLWDSVNAPALFWEPHPAFSNSSRNAAQCSIYSWFHSVYFLLVSVCSISHHNFNFSRTAPILLLEGGSQDRPHQEY